MNTDDATVLVVDDEPSIRRTFALFLTEEGYQVFEAADALSACSVLEARDVDVVISDIVLPHTDGVGLLATVAERWPTTRVVLVTGEPSVETASQALRRGAHDYLAKPVSSQELKGVVFKAVRQKRLLEENARLQDLNERQRVELAELVKLRTAQVHNTQQALQQSEARLSGLAANVPGVLLQFSYNGNDQFRIGYISERSRDMLSVAPEAVLNDSAALLERMHPGDRQGWLAQLKAATYAGATAISWQGRFIQPTLRWFEANARRQPGDHIWAAVLIDITDRKGLQARVMQSDRLATLGTMAAGVAHEINNPLTYLLNNLSLLRGAPELQVPHLLELLDESLDGATRVRDIVRSLKTFTRPADEERVSVELQHVLDSSIRMALVAVRHRATLTKEFSPTPLILGNAFKLGQVFLNLIVNAAQAIEEGKVSANQITVRTLTSEIGEAVIEISDTGSGMSEEVRARIFEPFFTTKAEREGTGLGLYICRDIVLGFEGRLELETQLGRGTTFRVVLPAAPKGSTARDSSPQLLARTAPICTGLQILVIDDEPLIGRSLGRLLAGNHVTTTTSGKAALRALSQQEFDVVFCDLMMPDMSGIDVFHALETTRRAQAERIVFMTGGAYSDSAREFLSSVPNLRLDKPIDPETVKQTLSRLSTQPPPLAGVHGLSGESRSSP